MDGSSETKAIKGAQSVRSLISQFDPGNTGPKAPRRSVIRQTVPVLEPDRPIPKSAKAQDRAQNIPPPPTPGTFQTKNSVPPPPQNQSKAETVQPKAPEPKQHVPPKKVDKTIREKSKFVKKTNDFTGGPNLRLKFNKNQDISFEKLQHSVGSLVDALSDLLLDSISEFTTDESLSQHVATFQHCVKDVLEVARGVAVQKNKDEPLVVPHISRAMKEVNEAVKGFVHVYPGYVQNRKAPNSGEWHVLFSNAAKELGATLDRLTIICDETSVDRVNRIHKVATTALSELIIQLKNEFITTPRMQKAIADYKTSNNKLIEVCNLLHQRSVNPNKKDFLNKALDSLEYSSAELMDKCSLLLIDAYDPRNVHFKEDAIKNAILVRDAYKDILRCTASDFDQFEQFKKVIFHVGIVVQEAKNVQQTSSVFFKCFPDPSKHDDLLHTGNKAKQDCVNLLACVKKQMQMETVDLARRAFIEKCMWQLEDDIANFDTLIGQVRVGEVNTNQAYDHQLSLYNLCQRIIVGTEKPIVSHPVYVATEALTFLTDKVVQAADSQDQDLFISTAKDQNQVANILAEELDKIAEDKPKVKEMVNEKKAELQRQSKQVLLASKKLYADQSEENKKELQAEQAKLDEIIAEVRTLETAPPGFIGTNVRNIDFEFMPDDQQDNALIFTSKIQIAVIVDILRAADKFAATANDTNLQKGLQDFWLDMTEAMPSFLDSSIALCLDMTNLDRQNFFLDMQLRFNTFVFDILNFINFPIDSSLQEEANRLTNIQVPGPSRTLDEICQTLRVEMSELLPHLDEYLLLNPATMVQEAKVISNTLLRVSQCIKLNSKEFGELEPILSNYSNELTNKGNHAKMIANNLVATGETPEGEASSAIFELETLLSTLLNEIVSHALIHFVENTQAQVEVLSSVLKLTSAI